MPVNAGLLRRALIRYAPVTKLHPNPDDEFCFPDIGPDQGIISKCEKNITRFRNYPIIQAFGDRITVQKIKPDGYMILNGHHRWAAAIKWNVRRVPIQIVDLTKESDIRKMLQRAKHDRRVSFDLDEVLFVSPKTHLTEPPLRFPLNRIYQERLRLGTPELIRSLQDMGREVWVYTSSFRSEGYIKSLFRLYGVRFDGIVNGERHLREVQRNKSTILPQKMPNHYRISLHVDDESVICSLGREYGFETYQLDA